MAAKSTEATRLKGERAAAEHDAKQMEKHEEFQRRARIIREAGMRKGSWLTKAELKQLLPK